MKQIRIDDKQYKKLTELADSNNITITEQLKRILEEYFEREKS